MPLNICTWICSDAPGEESVYLQMRGKSSSQKFQAVYWRNVYLFFLSSKKFNPQVNHILFSNCHPPTVDGIDINAKLLELEVTIISVPFTYKTPEGYYKAWRNQFYEFSILDYIAQTYNNDEYWLILDSDCVFTKSLSQITEAAKLNDGVLTYKLVEKPGANINGLTQQDMQYLYSELLSQPIDTLPDYHAGEFFFANTKWVRRFSEDFQALWPILLQRHFDNKLKLTEEAHVLSYLYYKNNIKGGTANTFIKRLWTQPFIYRNVEANDDKYTIWHVPHEKKYGLKNIFRTVIKKPIVYWLKQDDTLFVNQLRYQLTVPFIHPTIYATRLIPVQTARVIYYTLKNQKDF